MGGQDRSQSNDAETTATAYPLAHQPVGGGCPLGGGPFSDGATFEVTAPINEPILPESSLNHRLEVRPTRGWQTTGEEPQRTMAMGMPLLSGMEGGGEGSEYDGLGAEGTERRERNLRVMRDLRPGAMSHGPGTGGGYPAAADATGRREQYTDEL